MPSTVLPRGTYTITTANSPTLNGVLVYAPQGSSTYQPGNGTAVPATVNIANGVMSWTATIAGTVTTYTVSAFNGVRNDPPMTGTVTQTGTSDTWTGAFVKIPNKNYNVTLAANTWANGQLQFTGRPQYLQQGQTQAKDLTASFNADVTNVSWEVRLINNNQQEVAVTFSLGQYNPNVPPNPAVITGGLVSFPPTGGSDSWSATATTTEDTKDVDYRRAGTS